MTFDLTVAVLAYNHPELLQAALESVEQQRDPGCSMELLLLDNGSTPPLSTILEGWRTVRVHPNRGNVAGFNECVHAARGQWVLVMANDVRLHTDCLRHLWRARLLPQVGIVQPQLIQPDGQVDNLGLDWKWPGYGLRIRQVRSHIMQPDACAATCFLVHRQTFLEMGGMDSSLGVSHEDVELALRLREKGLRCYCITEALAMHLMGQTIAKETNPRWLRTKYQTARKRVVRLHYDGLDRMSRLAAINVMDWTKTLVAPKWRG